MPLSAFEQRSFRDFVPYWHFCDEWRCLDEGCSRGQADVQRRRFEWTQHKTAIFRQINKQKLEATMRWSFPMDRLCCSLAYTKPRGQLSCSFQPSRVLLRKRRDKIKLR